MYLMIAGGAVAVIIGFWPVRVDVVGDTSYYCGSGFVHSQHTWVKDGKVLINERSGTLGGAVLPRPCAPTRSSTTATPRCGSPGSWWCSAC